MGIRSDPVRDGQRVEMTMPADSLYICCSRTSSPPRKAEAEGEMRVRHEIGMHTGEREEFI